jgi:hypothetical protein
MRYSRARCSWCKVSIRWRLRSFGRRINVQKTRRQVIMSVGRTRTTLVSQWWGGAVMADDIGRLARLLAQGLGITR